jgi:preprotein translocase subunit SecG
MQNILPFLQIGVAIILIILILVQQRGAALGSAFGQDGGGFYGTLRGAEKKIFWLTCFFGTAFILLALLSHLYQ